ncbi:MAG: ABC transporter ATP-binding protein, partial [Clostridium sp.]
LMNEGVVQQFDIPQNLYLEPTNLFVAKFMGNPIINLVDMKKEGNKLVSKDFSIDLNLLNKDRFKGELTEENYIVGIRPEYFELSENPLFEVNVESVELIGKDCIINFKVNGDNAKSITDINKKVIEGDKIGLNIDYNGIYVFQENGVRVY